MVNNIEIKQLFNYSRFPDSNVTLLLFYLPIGVILVLLRLILLLIILLLATVLPRVQFLQVFYQKVLCVTFGISINAENFDKKEDVDAYLSNQLSVLDSFVLHLLTQCLTPAPSVDSQLSKLLGSKYFGPLANIETLKNNIALFNSKCKVALFLQPEAAITNGRGLLKFKTCSFNLASKIQPVLIEIKRPLVNIAISTIESTYWSDLLYYMFAPLTVYKVRFMPSVEKKAFSNEEFADKIRVDMGKSLKVTSTDFSAGDLKEFQKRYCIEQQRIQNVPLPLTRPTVSPVPELQRMGSQVKEVLPMVPLSVIYRDLNKTRNVDVTITNILEGLVPYVPESMATPSTSSSTTESPSKIAVVAVANSKDPFNTAASSFGKSANERSLSFHERKAQLIANARQRYIEKHGLNVALNC